MNGDRINRTLMMIEAMSNGASLDEMLKKAEPMKTLPEMILPRLRDMSYDTLGVLAGCSRANIYKLMSGKSHPEKDMQLRIAFVLQMDLEETQQMLKSAHRTPLSSGNRRDVCIMYGLMNHLDGSEMDAVLEKQNFGPLWPDE